ncbi:hypothetical protein H2O64_02745 [Kordia sp. YSTF-M3]|uniref:Elp3/MiaA/NifB-like radical SAM core domain-containing protein n=1 Tax=Kordia aestuariivivens TaxID=2759037 RepID=A0ABR7Q4Y4_9FLAO|nr:radical SAM protein [Kordia aestuariivivens]MBC8753573.1 hypothetical protein [Kordia aestuariivivens]
MKLTKKIQLIQPRHIYAPASNENIYGHIYLPTSLITAASILKKGGIEVSIIDENITPDYELSDIVGINLLGAPYLAVVREFEERLQFKYNNNYTLFIGGQIVNGLTDIDFENLFSKRTINGNIFKNIFIFFDIPIPNINLLEISQISTYELIPDKHLRMYLKSEFSFYLSQGCKYSCTFCSAIRTKTIDGVKHLVKEEYRDISIAIKDLEFILEKALFFKINKLKIYLSNLDLFQSPKELKEFASKVDQLLSKYRIQIEFRGLATVASFLKLHNNNHKLIILLKKIGLIRVGYGIDGATANVYKKTRKPQTARMCLDAIRLTSEYSITPETLMVFGHNNKEDRDSLIKAFNFCKDMLLKYNSLPRPHISKDIVPGNDGWNMKMNKNIIEQFYNDIRLFQHLDFTTLPSEITHPDDDFRKIVSEYYIKICELPKSLTKYTKPVDYNLPIEEQIKITKFNENRYDL